MTHILPFAPLTAIRLCWQSSQRSVIYVYGFTSHRICNLFHTTRIYRCFNMDFQTWTSSHASLRNRTLNRARQTNRDVTESRLHIEAGLKHNPRYLYSIYLSIAPWTNRLHENGGSCGGWYGWRRPKTAL